MQNTKALPYRGLLYTCLTPNSHRASLLTVADDSQIDSEVMTSTLVCISCLLMLLV